MLSEMIFGELFQRFKTFAELLMILQNLFGFLSYLKKILPEILSKTCNKKWLETEVSNHWKAIYNAGSRSIVHIWRPLLYQLSYTPVYVLNCFRCKAFCLREVSYHKRTPKVKIFWKIVVSFRQVFWMVINCRNYNGR